MRGQQLSLPVNKRSGAGAHEVKFSPRADPPDGSGHRPPAETVRSAEADRDLVPRKGDGQTGTNFQTRKFLLLW